MRNRHAIALALAVLLTPVLPALAAPEPTVLLDPAALGKAKPSPAQDLLNQGADALIREDHAAATAAFRKALTIDPKSSMAYVGLAEIAGREGKFADVDSLLQKAVAADPSSPLAHRTWARQLAQHGKVQEAMAAYKKAVSLDSKDLDARLDLAALLVGTNNAKAAEAEYRAAQAINAADVRVPLGLAHALAAQGQNEAAFAEFDRAAKLAPQDPKPWLLRSRLLASQLKFDDAHAALNRALAIAPDYLHAYIDQGDLYLAANQNDKAIASYRAAIKAVKAPALAHFRLAVVLEAKEQWAEAQQAYLDALAAEPTMFGAYNNLAFMAAQRKTDLDKALGWAKKAVEIAPGNPTLYDTLGWVHRARGEYEPAAKAIQKAIAERPKQASFHYHLGLVWAEMGRKADAVTSLKKALALDPNFRQSADAKAKLQQLGAK